VLLRCAILLVLSGLARAESPLEADARKHFMQGQQLFERGGYVEALDEYRRSYEQTHYPAILYRMALCQDLLGKKFEAIKAYREYLELDPTTERRPQVQERIDALLGTGAAPLQARALELSEPWQEPPRPKPHRRLGLAIGLAIGAAALAGLAIGLGVGLSQPSAASPSWGAIPLR
jgi:tetratricopeptide (TPR) repeat protein